MSISQFLRILWAYRRLILTTTVVCLVAAVAIVELVKPRYQAESRVMLDVIKPDPVTGQVMSTNFLRAFTKTQIELVKDPQTARLAVASLGWEKDPALQRSYRMRTKGKDLDFTRWASEKIADGADAKLIEGSNILEISFTSATPSQAKNVADALRKAYIEMTLQSRREDARRNADWYDQQAQKTKTVLTQAETQKAAYERQYGIVLGDDKIDIDSARLSALARESGAPVVAPAAVASSPAAMQVAQLDAEIATASKTLGPNHPQLLEMKRRREALAAQAAQDRNAASNAQASALGAARATSGMLESQKAKVMANREHIQQLRLMQDEIDLRRDQFNKTVARAAELRQEAEINDAGVVPLSSAITPQSPVFPKKGLIVGASVPAGLGLGVLIGLMLELFGRRVRSADDLGSAIEAPVLAVIRNPKVRKSTWRRLRETMRPAARSHPRVARA